MKFNHRTSLSTIVLHGILHTAGTSVAGGMWYGGRWYGAVRGITVVHGWWEVHKWYISSVIQKVVQVSTTYYYNIILHTSTNSTS